jgi:hypothetical protein
LAIYFFRYDKLIYTNMERDQINVNEPESPAEQIARLTEAARRLPDGDLGKRHLINAAREIGFKFYAKIARLRQSTPSSEKNNKQ